MNDFLHASTLRQLKRFEQEPAHAVLLTGPAGIGKSGVAVHLAEAVLGIDNFELYPYKFWLAPDKSQSLGIEAVRELEHFLSLKVPRAAQFNRAVLISSADKLTIEAQNALLKTLEEPAANSVLILTADNEHSLLPTVRSRLQIINLKLAEKAIILEHFKAQGYNDAQLATAYAISNGLPHLMQNLLDNSEHPLLLATQQARTLLSASGYERLLAVDELAKQKPLALDTARILQQMAHVSLQTATGASAERWQKILAASFEAIEALRNNAQPKLALTHLCLSL